MEKGKKQLSNWVFLCLLIMLAACDGTSQSPAVSSTQLPASAADPTEVPIITPLPQTLPRVEVEPTYISVSQFPISFLDAASAQLPAYISIEMAGFDIAELTWRIGRYEENCDRLVGMGKILPESGETWPDGVHEASFSWPAAGYFISDNEKADFGYVQLTDSGAIINGRYRSSSTGETLEANLLVDPAANRITGLASSAGQPLIPAAGDAFQLFHHCLEDNGTIRLEPGAELLFLEGGQLNFDRRPLPTGDYFLYLIAGSAQNTASSKVDFPVNNDSLVPDYQVYLNTDYGFQFLYPAGWQVPQLQNDRLVTGNSDVVTNQTVTIHPDMAGKSPADLKNQALTQFGDVTVLYENEVPVDDTGALWTAYGYEGPDGPHTGILLAFIHDDVGYTVDLDGLETAEQQTINLMSILSDTWLFRPDIVAPRAREWQAFLFDDLAMPVQASYYQQELENGWLRFSVGDGISFLAARTIPLGRDDLSDVVKHWRDVATRGVTDFTMSEDYPFTLNEREWSRTDFVYEREDGMQIQGFILVAEFDDRAVVFWAEMPISRYPSQSAQFLLSVAGLR